MFSLKFGRLLGNDVAVDLGTANTLIYVKGQGVVLREPSVVAVDRVSGNLLAVGHEAKRMLGKGHRNILAKRPLKDGVINDFELAQEMLYAFLKKVIGKTMFVRPRILVAVPSGITEVERRAVRDAAMAAGAREVFLVEEPVAAAVGIGLPVHEPIGNMIVDIGGGTTEIAVISLSGIVVNGSIRVAGDEMDLAIQTYIRDRYKMTIGEQTAEQIKHTIAQVSPVSDGVLKMEIRGLDVLSGSPRTIEITSEEIREALKGPLQSIVDAIKKTLERTPPELVADIIDQGIYLAGGGSLLKGLRELIQEEVNLLVHTVEEPLDCVVRGAGKIMEDLEAYDRLLLKPKDVGTSRRY